MTLNDLIFKSKYVFDWFWLCSASFILIILGVTFLQEIKTTSVRLTFVFALMVMSLGIVYYSFYFQFKGLRNIKERKE